MHALEFAWDPKQVVAHERAHAISFEQARAVFEDDEALRIVDPEDGAGEARFIVLGLNSALRPLVEVRCEAIDHVVSSISARNADPRERRTYAQRRTR